MSAPSSRHGPPRKWPADRANDPNRPDFENTSSSANNIQSQANRQDGGPRGVGSRWGHPDEPNLIAMAHDLVNGPLKNAEIERPDYLDGKAEEVLRDIADRKPINPVDAEHVRDLYWRAVAWLQFGRYVPWGTPPFGMLYTRRLGAPRWARGWDEKKLLPHVAAAWPCEGEA